MSLEASDIVPRIWARDHTVWKPSNDEIGNRLGWLDVDTSMRPRLDELQEFATAVIKDGITTTVLLGMGGSSLAPEVFRDSLKQQPRTRLVVLDTTHPTAIQRVETTLDLEHTLFIVASKSGKTIETLSHMTYFSSKAPPERFIAITDPGTPLEEHARATGFREVFINPPDIGGRYSALSLFGLVPAALLGVDLAALLNAAEDMALHCREATNNNPGFSLGESMGTAARDGKDKATIDLPEDLKPLGVWIEQLIAESSGKEDRGIVPIVDEPDGPSGDDRFRVAYDDAPGAYPLTQQPLGAEFFRWEFATAVACAVLGVNAFDQPNVEAAKLAASSFLESGGPREAPGSVDTVLDTVKPGDYIALQAFVDPKHHDTLQQVRARLRNRFGVATTLGFGPRFLHSTGQLHKGGANNVVCIQVVDEHHDTDVAIPGKPYTFGRLIDAQADGDLQALRARGRRVARTTLDRIS